MVLVGKLVFCTRVERTGEWFNSCGWRHPGNSNLEKGGLQESLLLKKINKRKHSPVRTPLCYRLGVHEKLCDSQCGILNLFCFKPEHISGAHPGESHLIMMRDQLSEQSDHTALCSGNVSVAWKSLQVMVESFVEHKLFSEFSWFSWAKIGVRTFSWLFLDCRLFIKNPLYGSYGSLSATSGGIFLLHIWMLK